jgi:hypothetical protein
MISTPAVSGKPGQAPTELLWVAREDVAAQQLIPAADSGPSKFRVEALAPQTPPLVLTSDIQRPDPLSLGMEVRTLPDGAGCRFGPRGQYGQRGARSDSRNKDDT